MIIIYFTVARLTLPLPTLLEFVVLYMLTGGAVGVGVTRAASMSATRVQIRAEQQQPCVFRAKKRIYPHFTCPLWWKQFLKS